MMNMNGNEMSEKTEGMGAPSHGMWTTPTSTGMRPRPATIHEGFSYCMEESYDGLPAWDSSTLPMQQQQQQQQQQQTPSDTVSSRPISVHQEFYPPTTMDNGLWPLARGRSLSNLKTDHDYRTMDAEAHGR